MGLFFLICLTEKIGEHDRATKLAWAPFPRPRSCALACLPSGHLPPPPQVGIAISHPPMNQLFMGNERTGLHVHFVSSPSRMGLQTDQGLELSDRWSLW